MPSDHATPPHCHGEFKHFKTASLNDGIFLAGFDYFGKSVNVLNGESMSEWQEIVQFAEQSAAIKGVVLVSMKEGNFCAGADLEQMHDAQQRRSFQEIELLVITAHRLLDAMGRSPKPFVAAVEAFADSSWCWPAICALPVPIHGPVLVCRKSSWAFFLGLVVPNVFHG